jgi:lipopolysaccharide export system protein LptA
MPAQARRVTGGRSPKQSMPGNHYHQIPSWPRFDDSAGVPTGSRWDGVWFVPLLFCLWSAGSPVAAQGLNLGAASEDRPIAISATSGIEWQQDAQAYIARGNATAKRGTTEVSADTLTAHYRPIKGGGSETEIYRLNADGHVTIKGETQTVVGDQAVWDVDQQMGIVTGKALKLTTTTDVVTARDSLEWYDQKQVAVARGDAVAVRENVKRVRADVLTAHMTKGKMNAAGTKSAAQPAKSAPSAPATKQGASTGVPDTGGENSRISRVDAQGNVMVSTATEIGRGDYGVYNADSGLVTLLGNVTITRGDNAIRGQYAVVDLNNNVSRMLPTAGRPGSPPSRVEGIFIRQTPPDASNGHGPNAATGSSQKP